MYKRIIHIVFFSLIAISQVIAQDIPWQVTPTAINHTVFIKAAVQPSIDGVEIQQGDAIGVFYDSLGSLACAGLLEWSGEDTFITIYGNDGDHGGLS